MRVPIVLAALIVSTTTAHAADLVLSIEGLRSRSGEVSVCLFDASADFPDCARSPSARKRTVKAAAADEPIVFPDLAPGTYAATVLHDENANGKLDTNLLGIPKEGVGITTNRLPRFSAPRFSDARFAIPVGRRQTVRIVYW